MEVEPSKFAAAGAARRRPATEKATANGHDHDAGSRTVGPGQLL
jgi:hypothetical protein